jgi:Domain of unknown function (DUF4276)
VRVGILVDGQAEFHSLPFLMPRIGTPHHIVRPLYCDIQPFATPAQMALAASKKFPILARSSVDLVVILIDKESRQDCTGRLASAIVAEANRRLSDLGQDTRVCVVLKVTKFENWLVADPSAIRRLPGLFTTPERIERKVVSGRADQVDAIQLLKTCHRRRFEKTSDAVAICKKLDPARAAQNSRSLDKLLRVLESPCARSVVRPPARSRSRRRK